MGYQETKKVPYQEGYDVKTKVPYTGTKQGPKTEYETISYTETTKVPTKVPRQVERDAKVRKTFSHSHVVSEAGHSHDSTSSSSGSSSSGSSSSHGHSHY